MSVLYPLPLRANYTRTRTGKRNSAPKYLFFFLIAGLSFVGTFAQDEKAVQNMKEAELKRQEAAAIEAKMRANPGVRNGVDLRNGSNQLLVTLPDAEKKKIAIEKANEKARKIAADKRQLSLPGVEYKVKTNSQGEVEYIVTNAGHVIFRQTIISSANLYDRKVQAEKEAIYASNTLRRNLNYPVDALKTDIRSLANQVSSSSSRQSGISRVTADYTFNGGGGTIPGGAPTTTSGPASPYPATITVSGVPAGALVKSVTISGMNHSYSDDIDIVLQSPTGVNVILMSDVGLSDNLANHNYTFSDGAALSLDDDIALPSGTYKPTNFVTGDNWVAPGPGTAPTATTLSTFGSANHNGTWNLFILDDVNGDVGDWASWNIVFTDPPPICFPINLTGQPANATVCSGANASFTVVATPAGVSYNWQVNTGSGFTYLTNGGVYSGVNTATLNITGATVAMNGYQYRVVITCSDGGLPEISNAATLTVNLSPPSPVLSPTTASVCPGGSVAINVVPGGQSYTASGPINVSLSSGPASPYPSTLSISGLPAGATVKQVILNGLSHTWPSDLDIVLQSPTGTNVILLSDRGGSTPTVNTTLTFDDAAAGLVSNTAIVSGTFRPTNTAGPDAWPAPGPASFTQVNPTLSTFAGNFNGTWSLFVNDQASGDGGSITSWTIIFTVPGGPTTATFSPVTGLFTDALLTTAYTGTAVSTVYAAPASTTVYSATINDGTCTSAPTNITVTAGLPPSITAQPANGNACAGGTKTLSVTATGAALTYQWQVDAGGGFINISNGFIYSGATTATLTINDVMQTMNGYKYRVIVSGACTPAITSTDVTLGVTDVPAISVASSSQCAPTTLTASGADTYSWSPSDGLSGTTGATVTANPTANTIYTVTGTTNGCSSSTQVDVKFTPPIPTVAPTAPIICAGAVQQLSITSSSLPPVANTTSSGTISVAIGNLLPPAISTINVAGVTGAVQSISVNLNITHTYDGDMTINLKAPNGNIYNLAYEVGADGDDFINTTFSSAGGTPIFSGVAPFTGTFEADGFSGAGLAPNLSNVTAWSELYSTPNGAWSLIVTDPWSGDNGTITSWSITINYAIPDAGTWTPVTGLFTNAAGTTAYVAGTPAVTVYAKPAVTTTYSAAVTNSSTETKVFSSGGSVTIPGTAPGSTTAGAGAPYPSTIAVSGLPTNAVIKSVTLKGVRHSFPDDLDILLQSPTGTNVVLMSDVGGSTDATGQNYTFDDAGGAMADAALNGTGTYRPTNTGASDTYPAPVGAVSQGTPALTMFTGDPNGVWNLYIADDGDGDIGSLSSWEIKFTIPTATNCVSEPGTVTVTVLTPIVFTTQPQNRTACQNGSVTFTAAATGTITTTQWQVSTNGGTTWTAIAGATTTSLTLTNVQPSQNGYRYRLVLSSAGCGANPSASATLTVNPLPTVSLALNPAGQTQLRPGESTTVTASSTPAGATYQWFLNGVAQPSITGATYAVDAYHLGTYTVRVTDVNGCVNTSAGLTFTALPTTNLFVYPNPTTGAFSVTYYMPNASTPVTITVIDMNGRKIEERHEVTSAPYTRFDFSSSKLGAGVYIIEFRNSKGALLESKQLVVTR